MTTGQPAADTWCGTCQSWRFDPYCGRDDCPGPQTATKITSWAELLGGLGKVPRYTLAYDSMEPDPDGEWVRYVDCGGVTPAAALDEVATLRAERDALVAIVREWRDASMACFEKETGATVLRVDAAEDALHAYPLPDTIPSSTSLDDIQQELENSAQHQERICKGLTPEQSLEATRRRARVVAFRTLRARVQQLEQALRAVLNSAVPHPEHHKAMTKAWAIARAALGTTLPVQP